MLVMVFQHTGISRHILGVAEQLRSSRADKHWFRADVIFLYRLLESPSFPSFLTSSAGATSTGTWAWRRVMALYNNYFKRHCFTPLGDYRIKQIWNLSSSKVSYSLPASFRPFSWHASIIAVFILSMAAFISAKDRAYVMSAITTGLELCRHHENNVYLNDAVTTYLWNGILLHGQNNRLHYEYTRSVNLNNIMPSIDDNCLDGGHWQSSIDNAHSGDKLWNRPEWR